MPDAHGLSIDIDPSDERLLITPRGEVDLSSSPSLRNALKSALLEGNCDVHINLSKVPYMDSSGVATLVEALQICKRQQRDLILVQPSSRVASIFKISKLDTVFTICEEPLN
jgi:anti-sigma B factor antagonist